MDKEYDVIVVGGGVAGLGCAGLLTKAGKKVLLVEKNNQVGGRAATFKKDGVVRSIGQHAMLKKLKWEELLKRLGVKKAKKQFFSNINMYFEGKLMSMNEILPLVPKRAAEAAEKMKAIVMGKVDVEAMDDISAADWLKQNVDSQFIYDLFEMAGAIMCTIPKLEEMAASVVYETVQILLKSMQLWLAADGLQEFHNEMAENIKAAGCTVMTGTRVQSVLIDNNTVKGVLIGKQIEEVIEGEFGEFQEIKAPLVILALPMWDIFQLVPENKFPEEFVNKVHYQTVRTANLGITALTPKPVYEGAKFFMVKFPSINHPGSMFVPTNVCPRLAPEGKYLFESSVICNYEELANDRQKLQQMLEGMKKDLQSWFPNWDKDVYWVSTYFHYEEPKRTPGRAGKHRLRNKAPVIEGLYFAGDSYGSRALPGLECASDSAMMCVKEILGKLPE